MGGPDPTQMGSGTQKGVPMTSLSIQEQRNLAIERFESVRAELRRLYEDCLGPHGLGDRRAASSRVQKARERVAWLLGRSDERSLPEHLAIGRAIACFLHSADQVVQDVLLNRVSERSEADQRRFYEHAVDRLFYVIDHLSAVFDECSDE